MIDKVIPAIAMIALVDKLAAQNDNIKLREEIRKLDMLMQFSKVMQLH